ncbi:MAG: PH domain-containing protein [Polyangiales bacterium]|nr:PH domain-containing protein [Myxococcales bacterium]MCB9659367.1 PH domain-containing protein [Sandaracinaceae bacterium]
MTTETQPPEQTLFSGHPALLPSALAALVAILTLGLALPFLWYRSRQVHYRITTQRIILEHGILSKRMDQVDTYRINDFVVERPFGQRLMGTGNIALTSIDRTNPEMRIEGIKTDVLALYEKLREAAQDQKMRRGVRTLDNSEHAV